MKYTTIVLMALFGYTQAVRLQAADELPGDGEERKRAKFPIRDDSDDEDNKFRPLPNLGDKFPKSQGKGMIFSAEAGANSEQGQSVKILPDTTTETQGVSSCWAKNKASEDSSSSQSVTKTFEIEGGITITETTEGSSWSQSQGESDGSAEKDGQQAVRVLDSDYKGKLGELSISSCPQPAANFNH